MPDRWAVSEVAGGRLSPSAFVHLQPADNATT